mgnify:CR=1 FL=1
MSPPDFDFVVDRLPGGTVAEAGAQGLEVGGERLVVVGPGRGAQFEMGARPVARGAGLGEAGFRVAHVGVVVLPEGAGERGGRMIAPDEVADHQVAAGFEQAAPAFERGFEAHEVGAAFGPQQLEMGFGEGDGAHAGVADADPPGPELAGAQALQGIEVGGVVVEGDDLGGGVRGEQARGRAGAAADHHIVAPYDDQTALLELASRCEAISCEFENVPATALALLEQYQPVRPAAGAVRICQDRREEKAFLSRAGIPVAPNQTLQPGEPLPTLPASLFPAILKTAREGYDGKGQWTIQAADQLPAALAASGVPCVLEQRLALEGEFSLTLARSPSGAIGALPLVQNWHSGGILDQTRSPANVPALEADARRIAEQLIAALDYVGVLTVEFFLVAGKLLVNELAPRPHNSGHPSLDNAECSQFELQVRALCDLPLPARIAVRPAMLLNLLVLLPLVWFVAKWSFRPIARLTRAVHELEMGKQQQLVDALSQEFTAVEEGIAKLTAEIELLEAKLEDARGRQKAMLLRSAAAQSRLNVQQHGQRATPHSIMEKFDRMERKIEEMESKADVYHPNPSLQQQFAELEADDAISRELAAMKERLQTAATKEE